MRSFMASNTIRRVVDRLIRRAQRHGLIRPAEIRAELTKASLSETAWEEALALAGPALVYHEGCYYPVQSADAAPDRRQQKIERTLGRLIRRYRVTAARKERRHQNRVDYIQPVEVWTEDGHEMTLLSRDLSLTGIRLISARTLLGE